MEESVIRHNADMTQQKRQKVKCNQFGCSSETTKQKVLEAFPRAAGSGGNAQYTGN